MQLHRNWDIVSEKTCSSWKHCSIVFFYVARTVLLKPFSLYFSREIRYLKQQSSINFGQDWTCTTGPKEVCWWARFKHIFLKQTGLLSETRWGYLKFTHLKHRIISYVRQSVMIYGPYFPTTLFLLHQKKNCTLSRFVLCSPSTRYRSFISHIVNPITCTGSWSFFNHIKLFSPFCLF